MCAIFMYAQKDVTQFLGIPVDGTKSEMIKKLKEKGFTQPPGEDYLEGEFNGYDVILFIVTNNNKVWRIMVSDVLSIGERDIQNRFNRLCYQFAENSKYTLHDADNVEDFIIPESENISYEMTVNKKRYEASFHQRTVMDIGTLISNAGTYADNILLSKYTKEQLENPTEEIGSERGKICLEYMWDIESKKHVWLMIHEFLGKYRINMYYDNKYNQANGEDL